MVFAEAESLPPLVWRHRPCFLRGCNFFLVTYFFRTSIRMLWLPLAVFYQDRTGTQRAKQT